MPTESSGVIVSTTKSRLIINADDFGLTSGVNQAIAELYRAGAVTSATLMADGQAFDDAVSLAKANPGLSVGCHVTLVDGMPVSAPESIPTLIGADGKSFRSSLAEFVVDALAGRIRESDIARETLAQIQKLQRAGIDVTHLDTHKHTHLFPAVSRPLLHIAERCSIGAVRNPFERRWSGIGSPVRQAQVLALRFFQRGFESLPQLRSGIVATTDGTIGVSATGDLNSMTLEKLLAAMPEGTWELVCHPGYNDEELASVNTRLREERNIERLALLDLGARFRSDFPHRNSPDLIHYGQLGVFSTKRELNQYTPPTGYERLM